MSDVAGDREAVLTLGQEPATGGARLAAAVVIVLFAGLTLFGAARADTPVAILPGFLPAMASLTFLADALTAYLLWGQARAGEEPALAVLAATYLGSALLVAVNAWLFPAAFLVAGNHVGESAGWVWVAWHLVFAAGVMAYGLYPPVRLETGAFLRFSRRIGGLMLVVVVGAVVLARSSRLPPLVGAGAHLRVPGAFLVLVPVVMAAAVAALAWRRRARTMLDTWLFVAMIGMWCDVMLTRLGGGRFTVGWYASHATSLAAALAVLAGCLVEVNRLYRRLVVRGVHMSDTNARLRAANTELSVIAERDELTGLLNRRAVLQRLAGQFAAWRQGGPVFSVLMIDLDHFKPINDALGHLGGDEILAQVARRLRAVVRGSDVVGRYGGEEFLVVLPDTPRAGARAAAAKLLDAVRDTPFHYGDRSIAVTVSIGGAAVDGVDGSLDDLIGRADRALYAAKGAGRDCQAWGDGPQARDSHTQG